MPIDTKSAEFRFHFQIGVYLTSQTPYNVVKWTKSALINVWVLIHGCQLIRNQLSFGWHMSPRASNEAKLFQPTRNHRKGFVEWEQVTTMSSWRHPQWFDRSWFRHETKNSNNNKSIKMEGKYNMCLRVCVWVCGCVCPFLGGRMLPAGSGSRMTGGRWLPLPEQVFPFNCTFLVFCLVS